MEQENNDLTLTMSDASYTKDKPSEESSPKSPKKKRKLLFDKKKEEIYEYILKKSPINLLKNKYSVLEILNDHSKSMDEKFKEILENEYMSSDELNIIINNDIYKQNKFRYIFRADTDSPDELVWDGKEATCKKRPNENCTDRYKNYKSKKDSMERVFSRLDYMQNCVSKECYDYGHITAIWQILMPILKNVDEEYFRKFKRNNLNDPNKIKDQKHYNTIIDRDLNDVSYLTQKNKEYFNVLLNLLDTELINIKIHGLTLEAQHVSKPFSELKDRDEILNNIDICKNIIIANSYVVPNNVRIFLDSYQQYVNIWLNNREKYDLYLDKYEEIEDRYVTFQEYLKDISKKLGEIANMIETRTSAEPRKKSPRKKSPRKKSPRKKSPRKTYNK